MQQRHTDPNRYFNEQAFTTEKYVIPFIQQYKAVQPSMYVLEIGCGEGGNLKPFTDLGCKCVGVDLSTSKIEKGRVLFKDNPNLKLVCSNIYALPEPLGTFNLIIIRDVIEHIHDQHRFLQFIKTFLKENAVVFVAFPPWFNPFGGHQQMCRSKLLSVLPYFHLLPIPLYRGLMKLFGESKATISGLLEIKETGINIEKFERLLQRNTYTIFQRSLYFINPNYEIKFGLKPRKTYSWLNVFPYVKNFYITCGYYLIGNKG